MTWLASLAVGAAAGVVIGLALCAALILAY
jgi:hypothetical protein